MPRLGLGVYQNRGDSCVAACTAALEFGYACVHSLLVALPRWVDIESSFTQTDVHVIFSPRLAFDTAALTDSHIDSAVSYKNEAEVGKAVKNFKRENIFISEPRFPEKYRSRYQTTPNIHGPFFVCA